MSDGGAVQRGRLLLLGLDDRGGSNKCINGYFTTGIIPGGSSPGGANLGASVIRITG